MATKTQDFFETWETDQHNFKQEAPDVMRAFGTMFQALMKEGALSVREKELIAVSLGLAVRCTPCINLHVKKALQAGASREQILEAAGVAVMMQGGPSYTYMPEVINALKFLEK